MKKINVITLGCSKNTVDSEHLMAQLAAAGYTVAADSDRTDARVVVVNTCGFIGDAKQESIDMILRAAAAKQAGRIDRLFVVGCLSERYADELRPELPEVDEFFGVKGWAAGGGRIWPRSGGSRRRVTTPTSKSARGATGSAVTAPFRSSAGRTSRCRWSRCSTRRGGWPPAACAN